MESANKNTTFGTFMVFLSAVCFSLGGLLMKVIPWNALAINGYRNGIALIVLLIYMKVIRHKLVISKSVILGALCIALSTITFSIANKLTTAGNAIILQFTAPIFVMLFSAILFGKRPTKIDLIAAAIVFAGVICFFVDSLSSGNTLGNIIALFSGVTYSGVFMLNAFENSDSLSSAVIAMFINFVIGIPWILKVDYSTATMSVWIMVLALGVVQLGVAYIFLATGLKTTPPVTASLVSGVEPVLNPILVAVFYGEMLTPLSLVGAVVVFITVLVYNVAIIKQNSNAAEA